MKKKRELTSEEIAKELTMTISETFRRVERKLLDKKSIKEVERRARKKRNGS